MSQPVALRQPGNVVVAVAVWLFCLIAVVDGILRGSPAYVVHAGLLVATVSVAAWIVFFRPRLIVADEGLVMVNVLRSYRIPFGALVSWHVGGVLTVEVRMQDDRIRRLTSWGAPGIKRQRSQPLPFGGRSRPAGGRSAGRDRNVGGGPAPGGKTRSAIDSRPITELAIESREAQWRRMRDEIGDIIARVRWNWPQLVALGVLIVANVAVG